MAALGCRHTGRHALAASRRPLAGISHHVSILSLQEQRKQRACLHATSSGSGGSSAGGSSESSSNDSGNDISSSSSSSTTGGSKPNFNGKQTYAAYTTEDEWRVLDKKVNKYPGQRTFSAIGTGGEDFKANMLQAVESVTGPVHVECISDRPSAKGKYISVRIGPVWVTSPDQVIEVFSNMRKDSRLKYYM